MDKLDERKKELEASISELESNLAELSRRLRDVEKERQHEAINNLDDYLKVVDNKYADMKSLWGAMLDEVKILLHKP